MKQYILAATKESQMSLFYYSTRTPRFALTDQNIKQNHKAQRPFKNFVQHTNKGVTYC